MKRNTMRIFALAGILAFLVGALVLLEALVWNRLSVQYHCAFVLTDEDGNIKEESALDSASFLEGAPMQYLSLGGESSRVAAKNGYGYKFLGWSDGETSLARTDRPFQNEEYTAYFTYDLGALPFLLFEEGNLTLVSEEGEVLSTYPASVRKEEVKTGYPAYKYPYRLTFDCARSYYGASSVEWQLLPVSEDPTLLRDLFAYELSSVLNENTPTKGNLVLFLEEGKYAGVCLLAPNFLPDSAFAFESGRGESIGLETLDAQVYGAILLSGEQYGLPDHYYKINKSQPYVGNVVIPYLYDCIFSDGSEELVSAVLDLPSAIDCYLLAEYMKNTSAGEKGVLLEYRDGKIYFLAQTCFTLSAGLDRRTGVEGSLYDISLSTGEEQNEEYGYPQYILYGLSKLDWFRSKVGERWRALSASGEIEAALQKAEALSQRAERQLSADKEKYPFYSVSNEMRVKEWAYYDGKIKQYTYREHVDALLAWLRERKTVLDELYREDA